ncbi:hypothetical protein HOG17_00935 [Candidatus Peregrinibacteria bacterium]|jgi:hypothetical protein|nr:hypothetical protein [Candidatus Peregrinibacteria bacterium]MBT4148582.1 hypothetical protein [Candidatus Peregrinibacteria bacterium]MBT4366738.1 hypothetical protein [Candidatus Peregrinibacteria bacterium]MBT4456359.1 hypothetical protein [Candidatus Peregrinibacteria bacterium]
MSLEKHEKKLVETVEKAEKPHEKAEKGGTELNWNERVKEAVKKGKKNIKEVSSFMEEFESSGEKGQYGKRKTQEFQKKVEDISRQLEGRLKMKKEEAATFVELVIFDLEAESELKAPALEEALEVDIDMKKAKHLSKNKKIVEKVSLSLKNKLKLDFALALADKKLGDFIKKNRNMIRGRMNLPKLPEKYDEVEMTATIEGLFEVLGVSDKKTKKSLTENLTAENLFDNEELNCITEIDGKRAHETTIDGKKVYEIKPIKNKISEKTVIKFKRQLSVEEVNQSETSEAIGTYTDEASALKTLNSRRTFEGKSGGDILENIAFNFPKVVIENARRKKIPTYQEGIRAMKIAVKKDPGTALKKIRDLSPKYIKLALEEASENNPQAIIDNLNTLVGRASVSASFIARVVEKHPETVLENHKHLIENCGIVGKGMIIQALKKTNKYNEAEKYLGQKSLKLVEAPKVEVAEKETTKTKKTTKPTAKVETKDQAKAETKDQPESKESLHGIVDIIEIKEAEIKVQVETGKVFAEIEETPGSEKKIIYEINTLTGGLRELTDIDEHEGYSNYNLASAGTIKAGKYMTELKDVEAALGGSFPTAMKSITELNNNFGEIVEKESEPKKDEGTVEKTEEKAPESEEDEGTVEKVDEKPKARPVLGEKVETDEGVTDLVQAPDGTFWRFRKVGDKKYNPEFSEKKEGPWYSLKEYQEGVGGYKESEKSSALEFYNKNDQMLYKVHGSNGDIDFIGSASIKKKRGSIEDPAYAKNLLQKKEEKPEKKEKVAEKPKSRPRLGEKVETDEGLVSIVEAGDGTFWRVRSTEKDVGSLEFGETKEGPWYKLTGYTEGKGGFKGGWTEGPNAPYEFYDKDDKLVYSLKFDSNGIKFIGTSNVDEESQGSIENPITTPRNLVEEKQDKPEAIAQTVAAEPEPAESEPKSLALTTKEFEAFDKAVKANTTLPKEIPKEYQEACKTALVLILRQKGYDKDTKVDVEITEVKGEIFALISIDGSEPVKGGAYSPHKAFFTALSNIENKDDSFDRKKFEEIFASLNPKDKFLKSKSVRRKFARMLLDKGYTKNPIKSAKPEEVKGKRKGRFVTLTLEDGTKIKGGDYSYEKAFLNAVGKIVEMS